MSTLRQAAQQALEALETNNQAWKNLADSGDAGFWEAEEQPFYETSVKAITALKAALAEPVKEPYAWMAVGGTIWRHKTSEDDVPLYTAPRVPLAEWQINDLMADIDPEDRDSWSFRQGVYAAEKHHGVRK